MAVDQVKKKKKKNAPDRQQPTWLFPPKEENPILNPKPVDEDQVRKAETERQNAVDFLKRRAYGVPDRPAPDPQLLNLIAVFLTEYGFSSTCRMFTTERNGRKTLNGWKDELGKKLKPGTPRLAKIYKDWLKEWEERRELDMTSDEDDDAATKREKMIKRRANPKEKRNKVKDEQRSSSGSDSSSDEAPEADVEMKDALPAQSAKQAKGPPSGTSSSASSRSSSSESDADDEKEATAVKAPSPKPTVNDLVNKLKRKAVSDSTDKVATEDKPSVAKKAKLDTALDETKSDKKDKVNKDTKKRKADKADKKAIAEEPVEDAKPIKKEKKAKKAKKAKKTDMSASKETNSAPATSVPAAEPVSDPTQKPPASSSSDSDSSSDSVPAPPKKSKSAQKTAVSSTATPAVSGAIRRQTSTDSSATLETSEPKKTSGSSGSSSSSSSSDSDSDSASTPPAKKSKSKRKSEAAPKSEDKPTDTPTSTPATADTNLAPNAREKKERKEQKKQNTPFSRIPTDTAVDPRVASNAYVPYDYAERAHRDLVVTKGKGFTKEKNKKKRGSYRGGVIDVAGRKGVKFDE